MARPKIPVITVSANPTTLGKSFKVTCTDCPPADKMYLNLDFTDNAKTNVVMGTANADGTFGPVNWVATLPGNLNIMLKGIKIGRDGYGRGDWIELVDMNVDVVEV